MRQFIIGIREHSTFGYTVSAYLVEENQDGFLKIIQNVLIQDIKSLPDKFTAEQKEIVQLTEEISDKSIYKKFVHKRNISFKEFFSSLDEKILESQILPFIGDRISKILRLAYWGNVRIFLKSYRYDKIYIDDELFYIFEPAEPVFYFEKSDNELKYKLEIIYKGRSIDLMDKNPTFLISSPCHFILDRRIYHSDNINCKKIKPFLEKEYITVRNKINEYFQRFVKSTVLNYKVVAKGFEIKEIHPKKKAVLELTNNLKTWGLVLSFYYDDKVYYPNDNNYKIATLINDNGYFRFTKFQRDLSWEENILYALKAAGLRQHLSHSFFIVPCTAKIPEVHLQKTVNWLNKNSDILKHLQIEVKQNTEKDYFTQKIDFNLQIQHKIDWFDIYATVKFGEFEIPFIQLRDAILSGKREFTLPNGQIAVIPEEWFAKYKDLLLFAKKDKKNTNLKISKYHFTLLEKLEEPSIKKSDIGNLLDTFKNKKWHGSRTPKTIKAKLRNYQKQGVAWINTLHQYEFGGCLADDMGLGKTLQTITAIAKAMEEQKKHQSSVHDKEDEQHQLPLFSSNGKTLHSLIIVPKSLVHNWLNEFKKFAPSYSVLVYTGTYRNKLRDKFLKHDFILTSYGVARNDIDFLQKFEFFYIVLDESQYIKNPNSKIYHAVRKLHGKHKLLLTGTPIENSLTDLWTQMNFANPGLLGSFRFFKEHFITPIERQNNEETKRELKQLISPFILRRTKQEVVRDLPDLIEQTIYCEMTTDQHLIYENEKSKVRNEILKIYESGKLKETSIYVLRALTKLRQIANHPLLISNKREFTSGKFEIVTQKIGTVIEENHKLLIFSSFVKHLELYKNYFDQKGWKYAMLTGESENREQIIEQFQNNDDVKIFLISLKAGGVGLNLTAADYVFLLDPWWNPAAEKQAVSRAHRIGQDKKVFVYRFITVGTVEEKIQRLQDKKEKLFKEFVESSNIFAQLSDEHIVELFD